MLGKLKVYEELIESCNNYINAINKSQLDNMMVEEGKIRAYATVLQDSNINIKYVSKDNCNKILEYIKNKIME